MTTLVLQLDEQTLEDLRRMAGSRGCTVEALITDLIDRLVVTGSDDRFLGMLADEPDLMDQVTESAMRGREEHPLRQASG